MKVRLLDTVALYRNRDPASPVVAQLEKGVEFELGESSRHGDQDWRAVQLSDGQAGFLADPVPVMPLAEMVLDQEKATLRAAPGPNAKATGELVKNDPLVILEILAPADGKTGPGWSLVRHPKLGEGYLLGSTRIRDAQAPELTYGRSFLVGALIITGLAAIGAVYLLFQGESAGAFFLLVTCFLAGGLGGLVYFATRRLREKEFGAHLSWTLVMATYLLAVGALLHLVGLAGWRGAVGESTLSNPILISGFIGACVAIGLILGYQEQRQRHLEEGRPWRLGERVVPLLAGAGLVATLLGLIWWLDTESDRPLVYEAAEPAQPKTLRDLLINGHGKNRFLRLSEFRYADHWIVEEAAKGTNFARLSGWVILVRANVPNDKKKARAILFTRINWKLEDKYQPPGPQPLEYPGFLFFEPDVMVMNGARKLPRKVRQGLLELAPDTDLERVLILSAEAKPIREEDWQERRRLWWLVLGGGVAALVVCGLYFRARRRGIETGGAR